GSSAASSASPPRRSTTCAPATSSANVPSAPDERATKRSGGAQLPCDRSVRRPRDEDGEPMSDWGFATRYDDVSGQVAIVGVGEAEQTSASGRTTTEIAAHAVERALADSGLAPGDVDGIMRAPFGRDQFDQRAYHAHLGTLHELR